MTIPRLASMTRYWNKHPPVHVLVAAYLGYEGKDEEAGPRTTDPALLEQLMATIPRVNR